MENLADYYSAEYDKILDEVYTPMYHENGFDFKAIPILTAEKPNELLMYNWGLIPWFMKSIDDGLKLRVQTLNCRSEDMYKTNSFKDSAKDGKRCLIPCTGFYEWKWDNPDDKKSDKKPHRIFLNDQPLFSLAGLYSTWKDKNTDIRYFTYTVLTTVANSKMENIHNTKKRQPVIIQRQYEKDWLSPNLNEDDVKAFCQPIDAKAMEAYTISKLITTKEKGASDVPKVLEKFEYAPTTLF